MLKRDEIGNLNSCWNRALAHERMFILLGRDAAAPETIRHWTTLRVDNGINDSEDTLILEALDCASEMEQQHEALKNELAERSIRQSNEPRRLLRKVIAATLKEFDIDNPIDKPLVDKIINAAIAEEKA